MVVIVPVPAEMQALFSTLEKNASCQCHSKHLVPQAISSLDSRWNTRASGGTLSALARYVVRTNNIGGVEARYQGQLDNDPKRDQPFICILHNGHNKTAKSHRDMV